MAEISEFEVIQKRISAGRHVWLRIHPLQFVENRLGPLQKVWNLHERCEVSLRGWNFPHAVKKSKVSGGNWVGSCTDFGKYLEAWKWFPSGLFQFKESFREEEAEYQQKLIERYGYADPKFLLNIHQQVYFLFEVFEFMFRYVRDAEIEDGVRVEISFEQVGGAALSQVDSSRIWFGTEANLDNRIVISRTYGSDEVLRRHRHLCMSVIHDFFKYFDWDMDDDSLRNMQDELYSMHVGTDRIPPESYNWDDHT